MNSKRIVSLLLAVIVAGTTAFLARAWLQGERAAILAQAGHHQEAPAPSPSMKVLVARVAIHTGQIIKPDDLRWQPWPGLMIWRSEEHTSELQSHHDLVCRLL